MLKSQDIQITLARVEGGRDAMVIMHTPTGIRREAGPPLLKRGRMEREMISDIEKELILKGLTEHILPDRKREWE